MGRCPFHSGPLFVDQHSSSAECGGGGLYINASSILLGHGCRTIFLLRCYIYVLVLFWFGGKSGHCDLCYLDRPAFVGSRVVTDEKRLG